ncbi:hypothetical protein HKCCE3408_06600 [Rhodobacterales bacterium HKCCE3408]|nr:hypothetical protein [Rhodobacterales bacterium HKCCE3408]
MTERAATAILALPPGRRMVALAGPPAAGKSTVSGLLCNALNAAGRSAVVLPMDGFHLDNRIIEPRGLLPRKGAPETFDVAGFAALVRRIAAGETVYYPVFDRTRDIAIAGAGMVDDTTDIVLAEGNYLALDREPWTGLAPLWDLTIWIDAAEDDLVARLVDRWLAEGLPPAAAKARAMGNDVPNAMLVRENRRPCDLELVA